MRCGAAHGAAAQCVFFLLVVFFEVDFLWVVFFDVLLVPAFASCNLSAWALVISPASTRAPTQACEIFLMLRDMQARNASVPSPYSLQ